MKDIAAHENDVGGDGNQFVDRARERRRDISLTLIDPGGGLPLILAKPQMQVGEMDEAHAVRNLRVTTRRGSDAARKSAGATQP